MAQTVDNSLEQRLADLEAAVRALQAGAALAGTAVGASAAGPVTLTGIASSLGSVAWDVAQGPSVDLYVQGGRLRVDVAASFEVYGNKTSLYVGYQIVGGIPRAVDPLDPGTDLLAAAPVVRAPDYEKSASLQDDGTGMNQLGAFGSFDLVTGLAVGWYRVRLAYALTYGGTTGAPYGIATNRRLSVTRY